MRFIKMKHCYTLAHDLTKNKGLEINFYINEEIYSFFNFATSWTRNQDHAGFSFEISIGKFEFEFKIYDGRHWNYEKNRYFYLAEEKSDYDSSNVFEQL